MTQFYIGVKQIEAWPEDRDGEDGYCVKYADGYTSWSPKDPFEAAYLPMGEGNDGTKITEEMVDDFTLQVEPMARMGNHSVCLVRMRNGFTLVEESACVDPENYDADIAGDIIKEKAKKRVWHLLGFLLAHARNGLTER